MTRIRTTFRSLRNRNYRLYFFGQAVSLTGTWMQRLGQEWLVLELTGSGTWLGITAALQFLPILLLAPWGGLLADRVDKRRLIFVTQIAAGLLALTLGIVVALGVVALWMVCVLALGLGLVTALDNPARQSFVMEMVGEDDVRNAVTLNSIVVNSARAVGPAMAGALIVTVGIAATFVVNAASYLAVAIALVAMDATALQRVIPTVRGPGQLREGLVYVWRDPILRASLVLMAVAGMFAYEFTVTLPLLARFTFDGDAGTLGMLNTALGAGAIAGGLVTAGRPRPDQRTLVTAGMAFGVVLTLTAAAPTLLMAMAGLFATGAISIQFLAVGNSLLQLHAGPAYRGRVMALWAVAFLGTTPIGGPLVGLIGEHAGPRASLAVGGLTTLVVAFAIGKRMGWHFTRAVRTATATAGVDREATSFGTIAARAGLRSE